MEDYRPQIMMDMITRRLGVPVNDFIRTIDDECRKYYRGLEQVTLLEGQLKDVQVRHNRAVEKKKVDFIEMLDIRVDSVKRITVMFTHWTIAKLHHVKRQISKLREVAGVNYNPSRVLNFTREQLLHPRFEYRAVYENVDQIPHDQVIPLQPSPQMNDPDDAWGRAEEMEMRAIQEAIRSQERQNAVQNAEVIDLTNDTDTESEMSESLIDSPSRRQNRAGEMLQEQNVGMVLRSGRQLVVSGRERRV